MSRKCVRKTKHGKQCAIVISDNESNSKNYLASFSPLQNMSDVENEIKQILNDTDSETEESRLEYQNLANTENEIDRLLEDSDEENKHETKTRKVMGADSLVC